MDEVKQVLFGMDGFRVLAAVADPLDDELGVLVETIDPSRGCPECGVVGQVKQRPVVTFVMPPRPGGGSGSGGVSGGGRVFSRAASGAAGPSSMTRSAPAGGRHGVAGSRSPLR